MYVDVDLFTLPSKLKDLPVGYLVYSTHQGRIVVHLRLLASYDHLTRGIVIRRVVCFCDGGVEQGLI